MASTQTKPWYMSKGIWGGVLAAIVGFLGLFGFVFPPEFVEAMSTDVVATVTAGVALTGGVLAIIGRLKAVKKVGK